MLLKGLVSTTRYSANRISLKIPALHLQRIDMKVRHKHVPWSCYLSRWIAWIRPVTMGKLIATAGGQLELFIAIGKRYKVFRQIKELLRDEMDHLTFTLYPSVDRHHRRAEHDALALLG